jgi:hypothetical protein
VLIVKVFQGINQETVENGRPHWDCWQYWTQWAKKRVKKRAGE